MDGNQVLATIVIDVCYIMLGLNNILCVGYVVFYITLVGVDVIEEYGLWWWIFLFVIC
jgi:hypothetical protein